MSVRVLTSMHALFLIAAFFSLFCLSRDFFIIDLQVIDVATGGIQLNTYIHKLVTISIISYYSSS